MGGVSAELDPIPGIGLTRALENYANERWMVKRKRE